ncbi:unnamed protein product [Effrenium voratum]|uniref:Uncharacterized protein n=1 Tax=Effrenium voratum TaxID=2562239 RepID=A0AA36HN62_9DINO|nr:unnamed protein product [Effrenium voratum]
MRGSDEPAPAPTELRAGVAEVTKELGTNFGPEDDGAGGDAKGVPRDDDGSVHYDGGVRYTGQWLGEMRHGFGLLEREGSCYEGQFQNNMAHGSGRLVCGGDTYDGEWREDKAHGFGRHVQKDGPSTLAKPRRSALLEGDPLSPLSNPEAGMNQGQQRP